MTLEKYKQKLTSSRELLLFKEHYANFQIKQRANYANIKENFITQVNLV